MVIPTTILNICRLGNLRKHKHSRNNDRGIPDWEISKSCLYVKMMEQETRKGEGKAWDKHFIDNRNSQINVLPKLLFLHKNEKKNSIVNFALIAVLYVYIHV